jgi:hypothetical protein
MGLDMFAYVTEEKPATAVDFPEPAMIEKLHYWRKHPNLHGWMEKLYAEKGGEEEDFNLAAVILDSDDLDQLEAVIVDQRLPETSGFFFGESDGSERDDDLAFIGKARAAIASGKTVYYVAWW